MTGTRWRQRKKQWMEAAYLTVLKQNTFFFTVLEHDFGSFQNHDPIFIKELCMLCWMSHF